MDVKAILMGLSFALIWSSAFTSARIIVTQAPPLTISALRFFIAGLIALALARAMGQSFGLSREQWRTVIVFGICQNALYLGANFVAMQTVEASLASIIASTMPLLVALAGWLLLSQKLSRQAILGLAAGFGGVLIIMGGRLEVGFDTFGISLCIIGVLGLTVATMLLRGASSGGNFMMVVGLQMLIGAVPLAVLGLSTETLTYTPSPEFFAAFAYTTLFPGLIATLVWFHLVNRIGATQAATFHFLNPFFGVAVAWSRKLGMSGAVTCFLIMGRCCFKESHAAVASLGGVFSLKKVLIRISMYST